MVALGWSMGILEAMNKRDFFRRLGLAVAALFVPKGVKGKWLETARGIGEEPFTVSITNCRFVDCRFEEPIKAPRRGGLVKVRQGVTLRSEKAYHESR